MPISSRCNARDGCHRGDACVAPTVSGPSRRMSSQREMVLIPGPGHDLVECLADYSSSHASKRALIRS